MILRTLTLIVFILSGIQPFFAQDEVETESYDYEEEYEQDENPSRLFLLDVQINSSDALQNYNRSYDSQYFGLGASILWQLSIDRPGFIGIDLNYTLLQNGRLNRIDPVDGFELDYRTSVSLSTVHFVYRHYLGWSIWKLEPFVEGRLGYLAQATITNITSPDDPDYSESDYDNFSLAPTYGVAFGLHFPIKENFYITSRANYLKGLSTKHHVLDEDIIPIDSSLERFREKRSALDVIRYDIGVTFTF